VTTGQRLIYAIGVEHRWNLHQRQLSPAAAWYFTFIVYSFSPCGAKKNTQRGGIDSNYTIASAPARRISSVSFTGICFIGVALAFATGAFVPSPDIGQPAAALALVAAAPDRMFSPR
jgi:hypothetical protein